MEEKILWDCPPKGEAIRSFYETIKASLVNPASFFDAVAKGEGLLRPWLYAVVISVIVFACAAAYQAGFATLQFGTEAIDAVKRSILPPSLIAGPFIILFLIFFALVGMPIAATAGLFIQAGFYHLGLLILGAAKRDFSATFRTVCYSMGPQIFQIVPFFGGLIAGFWVIVLNIIGLKVVHETTYARSSIAVFLPLIICCGLLLVIFATLAGGIFAALVTSK